MNGTVSVRRLVAAAVVVLFAAGCSSTVPGSAQGRPQAEPPEPASTEQAEPTEQAGGEAGVRPLVGTWEGRYVCRQGETGMRLVIDIPEQLDSDEPKVTELRVIFAFFPVPENPSVPRGSYSLVGAESADGVLLAAEEWIDRPADYLLLDLLVTSDIEDGMQAMTGTVQDPSCETFSVNRRR